MSSKPKLPLSVLPNTSRRNKTGNWRAFRPKFLPEKCIACGKCRLVCPEGVCQPNKQGKKNAQGKVYFQPDLDYCKGCGLCAKNCPAKAIEMELEEK